MLSAPSLFSISQAVEQKFRTDEYLIIFFDDNDNGRSTAFFSVKTGTQEQATKNMQKTFFIMLLLVAGFYLQKKDSEELVIKPIERMVKMVKQLSENPLQKTKVVESSSENSGYETLLLEQTLSKIGGLLQIGFGQAGDEIIGKNMSGGGELDPMIPGKKIYAIFGFCDIRYFVAATEYLQQDVMVSQMNCNMNTHSAYSKFTACLRDVVILITFMR